MADGQSKSGANGPYRLEEQVGFVLRRATQRHLSIFTGEIPEVTPMQFAALAKLQESGAQSQNALGRETAMDAATIKGVVDRLVARGLLETRRDTRDRRRTLVGLTEEGRALFLHLAPRAAAITEATLAPLSTGERARFLELLARIT